MLYVRLAQSDHDRHIAQRLRYDVFVTELGADGPTVNHSTKTESDRFDDIADHLLLCCDDRVVGTYRLLPGAKALAGAGFYSESEFDLGSLSAPTTLELGRSCIDASFRTGAGIACLWAGLSDYVRDHGFDHLVGVASFHGVNVDRWRSALSYLHQSHLAPKEMRPKGQFFQPLPQDQINRKSAVLELPTLIKSYLRLGATVGEGIFVDHAFNTIDVCITLDVKTAKGFARPMKRQMAGE